MCSVTPDTRAAVALVLLSATLSTAAASATMDDELSVDPTVPLARIYAGNTAAAGAEGDGFNLAEIFSTYALSSVLIRAEDRVAVINGQRVRVGDRIGGAVVAAIETDQVTLNVDGEMRTLQLYENSIRTRAKGDE